jgi:hypothetical protein
MLKRIGNYFNHLLHCLIANTYGEYVHAYTITRHLPLIGLIKNSHSVMYLGTYKEAVRQGKRYVNLYPDVVCTIHTGSGKKVWEGRSKKGGKI